MRIMLLLVMVLPTEGIGAYFEHFSEWGGQVGGKTDTHGKRRRRRRRRGWGVGPVQPKCVRSSSLWRDRMGAERKGKNGHGWTTTTTIATEIYVVVVIAVLLP